MTATMSKPTIESTLHGLVRLYWAPRGRDLSATKQEVADSYYKLGVREGIAAILFQHRGDSLPRFKSIPMIYESDVNMILRKYETKFVHGSGPEKNIVLDAIFAELIDFAVPQDLIETDEEERRRLVLAGEEAALDSDHEWIQRLAEEKRREAEALIGLLTGKGSRKVNEADALYRCTRKECAGLPEHRRSLHAFTMRQAGRMVEDADGD